MKRALVQGTAVGAALPVAVILALFWAGALDVYVGEKRAFHLLPFFTFLALPAGFAAVAAAQRYDSRKETWRFLTGLMLGGSLIGSVLLLFGYDPRGSALESYFGEQGTDASLPVRIIGVLFGGVFLIGFWLWLGGFLGAASGYARRERLEEKESLTPPSPDA